MRNTLLTVIGGAAVVVAGIALGVQYDLEWLRIGAIFAGVAGAALLVMLAKRRSQAKTRSAAPDSVETAQDVTSRAGAFVDAAVLTAIAFMVSTLMPAWPSWVMCFALLLALTIAYWVRRLVVMRNANR